MKKTLIPVVLLGVGAVGLITMLFPAFVILFVKHDPKAALVFIVPGLSRFALYLMLGCTARALYTQSSKVLFWLKALKWAAYLEGAVYVSRNIYWATHASIRSNAMQMPSDYGGLVLVALNLLSGLIILDLITEYIKLKAESFLTV